MTINPNLSSGVGPSGPAIDLIPITPNDDADLPDFARAIRCNNGGTAGTLRVTTNTGQVRNTDIAPGEVLALAVVRVHTTGTTATGLEAMI
jgi:hypothetical protein